MHPRKSTRSPNQYNKKKERNVRANEIINEITSIKTELKNAKAPYDLFTSDFPIN